MQGGGVCFLGWERWLCINWDNKMWVCRERNHTEWKNKRPCNSAVCMYSQLGNKGERSEVVALERRRCQGHIKGFLDLLQKEQESNFPLTEKYSSKTLVLEHLLAYWRSRVEKCMNSQEKAKSKCQGGSSCCAPKMAPLNAAPCIPALGNPQHHLEWSGSFCVKDVNVPFINPLR